MGVEDSYSVAIIGGGVVGLAVLRALSTRGVHSILLEKNEEVLNGASAGNSGIFHTGFDAPPNSIELECMKEGHSLFMDLLERYGDSIPHKKTGALVVAWNEEELAQLSAIIDKATLNGVEAVLMGPQELKEREPHLSSKALGAVYVPGELVVDPWILPVFYLSQSLSAGACVERNFEVINGNLCTDEGNGEIFWELISKSGSVIKAKVVINCAGNYGDVVERISGDNRFDFKVTPRKGQFAVLDPSASQLVNSIILPVPTERTKGVLVSTTVFGNVIVGPTAEDQEQREEALVDQSVIESLLQRGRELIPELEQCPVVGTYAGLRPATQYRDYQIGMSEGRKWITVGGIRSTGLTASMGIGEYVWRLYQNLSGPSYVQKVEWYPFSFATNRFPHIKVDVNGYEYTACHRLYRIGHRLDQD